MLTIAGMMAVNAMRTIEGKVMAWKNKGNITTAYQGGGNMNEGSKRGKGMS